VRQWDARSRRTTAGRRHTRHHLKSNALCLQGLNLFPAAAKYIGVTSFEAHHSTAAASMCDHQCVNTFLRHCVVAQGLTHIDALGLGWYLIQDFCTDQAVVHHDIGAVQPV
jgi:hypothetical protein